ncbi:hypothetical protein [Candidatus Nitrosocosmicus arcticus]|uniref:Uncharacterized protein n=1 Tax=Candidatus Nitrosocosmicus arcticus TaxID=2035267 RepID=A0A557SRX3_9ARCH|nr:hypothetical protein [Candidatus Nitrosocosmicus arcticus]TVP39363.1 hypothetical protein NARC_160077 [Candidatus Nitrosocosmicus arcticus]
MSTIGRCCDGMESMINDNVLRIDNMSGRVWVKMLIHNETHNLEPYNDFVEYNEATYCQFCGQPIQIG